MLELRGTTLALPANYQEARAIVLDSPCTSFWLREQITRLDQTDPVDAARKAEILAALAQQKARELLGEVQP